MLDNVIKVIAEQLNIDASKITADSKLADDLKADSLDIASMLLELEEAYGIEIPDEELTNLITVGDIANYISAKTQN